MVEIPDDLLCVFSARVDEREGTYVLEVPESEVTRGQVDAGGVYRVALLPARSGSGAESGSGSTPRSTGDDRGGRQSAAPSPPVSEGERREVEIEDIGEQGDGIARVERGYVIIVPDTELHERVTIEITSVAENVAFGEVVERHDFVE